jgi:hypothetical protein
VSRRRTASEGSSLQIAPVRKTLVVQATAKKAFDVFTAGIDRWWPKTHGIGAGPVVESIIEPFVGGRWYSRHADGAEAVVGHVLVWEPAQRFVCSWEISADWKPDARAAFASEVEVRFVPEGPARRASSSSIANSSAWRARRREDAQRRRRRMAEDPGVVRRGNIERREIGMTDIKVHSVPGSPYGRAVLIALEEKAARLPARPRSAQDAALARASGAPSVRPHPGAGTR